MTLQDQEYIKANRLSLSMIDMAKALKTSYNQVRDYMIKEDLMLTQAQINKIKLLKRKKNKANTKPKAWDWDALP